MKFSAYAILKKYQLIITGTWQQSRRAAAGTAVKHCYRAHNLRLIKGSITVPLIKKD
jgi:hypothetical protein